MKSIIQKINENERSLTDLVQYETGKSGAYSTFVISDFFRYKYAFTLYDEDQEFVSVIGFNDPFKYEDEFGLPSGLYQEYIELNKGESKEIDGSLVTRLW